MYYGRTDGIISIVNTLLQYYMKQKSKQAVRQLMDAAWIIHVGVSLQCPIAAVDAHTKSSTRTNTHINTTVFDRIPIMNV